MEDMNGKRESSIVLASLASIAVAGSLIAGATYALFASESKADIVISSGKVDVAASISGLTTYTGQDLTGEVADDEEKIKLSTEYGLENGAFMNGGTATIDGNELKLVNMTPGDKVAFAIEIKNGSNVAAKYRMVTKKDNDTGLFNGLEIKVGEDAFLGPSLISSYEDLIPNCDDVSIPVVVDLPSDRGNAYQGKKCDLLFSVEAVQGNVFTGFTYEVTSENVQEYLDGQHGSLDGATLVLTDDTGSIYGELDFGRATKYVGSNTQYYIGGISSDKEKTLDEFLEIKNGAEWSDSSYYVRNINNLTIKAKEGKSISVAGLSAAGGQAYASGQATVYDYVLEKNTTGYYLAQNWSNVKFEDIKFTGPVKVYSSQAETSIDGVTFKDCSFTIGDISSGDDHQGLRYMNECKNAAIKNLIVYDCSFESCYQGMYTSNIYNVWVIDSRFKTTGHNAIAIQNNASLASPLSHGAVIIKNNAFDDIGDRFMRFGYVGSDTQILIRSNKATNVKLNSGGKVEVAKAGLGEEGALADGIIYDIHGNDWGGTVADEAQGRFLDE